MARATLEEAVSAAAGLDFAAFDLALAVTASKARSHPDTEGFSVFLEVARLRLQRAETLARHIASANDGEDGILFSIRRADELAKDIYRA